MTETEALKAYAERCAPVCGWPEWGDKDSYHWKLRQISSWEIETLHTYKHPLRGAGTVTTGGGYDITPHEALCLWRKLWLMA